MKLNPMRYKDYVWPHNPRVYAMDYERKMAVNKVPFGRYQLQDLGLTRRVLRGEGEFVGPTAYEEFKKLASVFYQEGAGILMHPVWQAVSAYFVALSLRQEPRADYVKYDFTFWENFEGHDAALKEQTKPVAPGTPGGGIAGAQDSSFHTVSRGETLWGIANKYSLGLTEIIALNPQIKNPNFILAGERIRIK